MKWIITAVVLGLLWGWADFCMDCEPAMKELKECTIHPVYNCHQSKYQHWTDMNKKRDGNE
jgi:hypothetical protein